ncbi:MAG TPA: hypothetical protein VFF15_06345 [Flavobacteriaceae bacterium]|nr:hypothetical protein [Flavobacteriaceae bacterium]
MKLLHRLGYYLGGFSIGLIFLAFFLNGKKVSCDYGPQARTLKNINAKKMIIPEELKQEIALLTIDTLAIKEAVKHGTILFSKSNPRKEPCGEYVIENTSENTTKLFVTLQNCDSLVTITAVTKE